MRRHPFLSLAAAVALVAGAAGCGAGDESGGNGVTVVATTTQAADLARQVAGGRAHVVGLLPAGVDPHDHEVRPDDVKALADAALVVRSGGEVDAWLEDAVASSGTDAPTLSLIEHVRTRGADPHWWQDPANAIRAVAAIRGALERADPTGARGYAERARATTRRLEALDAAAAACLAGLGPAERRLVTTHDSLGYFAARYGLDVVGAVIPSLSTQAQPSAGETAALVDLIRRERVKAIFPETSLNPKVEAAIARETGATVGRPLWADSLGPAESDGATYAGAIAANTRSIAEGLSGGALSCRLPA